MNADGSTPSLDEPEIGVCAQETLGEHPNLQEIPAILGTPPRPEREYPDVPFFILPSNHLPLTQAARHLFQALAPLHQLFCRAGTVVEVNREEVSGELRLSQVRPDQLPSRLELLGQLWRHTVVEKEVMLRRANCSKSQAELLLGSREALKYLPPITIVVNSPVLIEGPNGKGAVLAAGYHRHGNGILVTKGERPFVVPLDEAVEALLELTDDFDFELPSDRTRAIAMMLTPALLWGGHLGREPAPMFMIGADQSQAGKGRLSECTGMIYGEPLIPLSPRKGGVGSFDEDFNAALFRGRPFVFLDNLRQKLDSTHIESFLTTRGSFSVRTPHRAAIEVDASKYIIIATSNGFETTSDLENRLIRIQIRKRPDKHQIKFSAAQIERRQPFYLGCVFSILSHWLAEGRPRTREKRHSFHEWARALDWILLNTFKGKLTGRLMDDRQPANEGESLAIQFGFEELNEVSK